MSTPLRETLSFESIDDYLGPTSSRFFGSGYRSVDYAVDDIELGGVELGGTADGLPSLTAGIGIRYPVGWSTKTEGIDLRPHLSTIDVLILAVRAAEFLARHHHGLDSGQRARTWLRRVDIKAPTTPVEERLDKITVTAKHTRTMPLSEAGDHRVASTYDCRVATMRARVELVHEPGGPIAATEPRTGFGSGYPGLYGNGFHHQWQTIDEVVVDVAGQLAEAEVTIGTTADRPAVAGGPESADGPVVSMVDGFAVALQLGQVLLYEADRMTRAESNTLWMRHTTITAGPPGTRAVGRPFRSITTLEDSRLLHVNDDTWRTATVTGDCLGIRTRCSVTHRLPARP
jgi:hypothetical protein